MHRASLCSGPSLISRRMPTQLQPGAAPTSKQLLQQLQLPLLLLQHAGATTACCRVLLLRKGVLLLPQLPQQLHVALQNLQRSAERRHA